MPRWRCKHERCLLPAKPTEALPWCSVLLRHPLHDGCKGGGGADHARIDIIKLDDWLIGRHGEYEGLDE